MSRCRASATLDLDILGPSIHCSSEAPPAVGTGILLVGESVTLDVGIFEEHLRAGLALGVALCAGDVCFEAVCARAFTALVLLWAGLRSSRILLGFSAPEPRNTLFIAHLYDFYTDEMSVSNSIYIYTSANCEMYNNHQPVVAGVETWYVDRWMFAIGGIVGAGPNVDDGIGREVARAGIALAVLSGGFLARAATATVVLGTATDEAYFPTTHAVDARGELARRQRLAVVLGVWRDMGDHGRVASQRAQALLEQLGELVLLVGKVLLPVEYGQQDVAQSRERDAPGRLATLRVADVDQVEPAATSGNCKRRIDIYI